MLEMLNQTVLAGHAGYQNHEQIVALRDEKAGLTGFIAIHDTTLGPAMGGCRMWNYTDEASALTDALRLSAGMTAKNALADLAGKKRPRRHRSGVKRAADLAIAPDN